MIGNTASWQSGIVMTSSARPGGSPAPAVTIAMIGPWRALIYCIEETIFGKISPAGANNTLGHFALMSAMGPCFISAAG